jgi:hypothetical protein
MNSSLIALVWVIARLKEPSSYAGLAGLLLANHVAQSDVWAAGLTSIGIGIASIAAIFLPEKSNA